MTNQLLIARLQDTCGALSKKTGPQQALTLLEVSEALLQQALPAAEKADEDDFDDLYVAWLQAARQVSAFAEQAGRRLSDADTEALRKGGADRVKALEAQRSRSEQELQSQQALIRALEAGNADRRTRLEAGQAQVQAAKDEETRLNRELEQCSEAVLAGLADKNRLLTLQLEEARPQLTRQQAELARQRAELAGLQTQIDAIPAQDKALRQQYLTAQQELTELQQAAALYGPESQAALRQQIDALTPELARLNNEYSLLREALDKLNGDRTALEEEFPRLKTEAFEKVNRVLALLGGLVGEKAGEIERIKQQSDTLEENLNRCSELRVQYVRWLNGVETPLEALLKQLPAPEAQQLRDTLDPAACDRIKTALTQAKDSLDTLDGLLQQAQNAFGRDAEVLKGRVNRRG